MILVALAAGAMVAGGWGVDAYLTGHARTEEVPEYLRLLEKSGVRWLRERGLGNRIRPGSLDTDYRQTWRAEKKAGFSVVAFASSFEPIPVLDPVNQLPEDLRLVFRESSRLAEQTNREVDAWEMVGEPEVGYCRDLPDRVAAFQKAMYLGIKAGARRLGEPAPGVMMGGLALMPGPWLEAAARNGFYDYTDTINIHHYGFARDFGDAIAAHRAVAERWSPERKLPMWVTEAGYNNLPFGDQADERGRREQADFIEACAEESLRAGVAVFMPFILVHTGDPYALTETARQTYPAWDRYAELTRRAKLGSGIPAFASRIAPNPIVLQWLPDVGASLPSKNSRAYWFRRDGGGWMPMRGKIHVYNFGVKPAWVRVRSEALSSAIRLEFPGRQPGGRLKVPARGRVTLPVIFRMGESGFARRECEMSAETEGSSAPSGLYFTVETPPDPRLAASAGPIRFAAESPRKFAAISGDDSFVVTSRMGPWVGINGVDVQESEGSRMFFGIESAGETPMNPPMAIAALPEGLPPASEGALRLSVMGGEVRVDLIDEDGQRFTIGEDLGRTRGFDPGGARVLRYRDFYRWVFGRGHRGATLDPARVREMQLRFHPDEAMTSIDVQLDALNFSSPQ